MATSSTDDAYVNGNLVRLTPQVTGTVIAINTDETQFVQRGAGAGAARAARCGGGARAGEGQLAQTVRDVAQLFTEEAARCGAGAQPAGAAEQANRTWRAISR